MPFTITDIDFKITGDFFFNFVAFSGIIKFRSLYQIQGSTARKFKNVNEIL